MYSLDINFLKDRYLEDISRVPTKPKAPPSMEKQRPILLGAGAMLLLLALAGGWVWFFNWQAATTQANLDSLDQELSRLNAKNQSLKEIKAEIDQINQETDGLVGVFNQIKSWSAILQDIRDRTPPRVQIANIQQSSVAAGAKSPPKKEENKEEEETTAAAKPTAKLSIKGYAPNYDDANDFLLALQGSSFLTAEKTKLESAKLVDLPVNWQGQDQLKSQNLEVIFPQVVEYTITTELNQIPASQLRAELQRKSADGLVVRLENLEQVGGRQP